MAGEGTVTGKSTVAEELEAARRELREGAVAAAVARLETLRARAPGDARVAAGLARAYLRQGRVDAALMVAQDAVRCAPASSVALVALGQSRKAAHDLEGAVEAFTRARAVDDTSFVCTQLGRVLLQLGHTEEALDTARAALRRHGRDLGLLELEGDTLQRLGRRDEAIAAYEAARALEPADPLAEKRLLEARLRELAPGEAIDEVARLLQVPSYAERAWLHAVHGRLLHEAGRHAEAAAAFTRALSANPEDAFARRSLGFAAWKAGDAEAAVQALRSLFLLDPGDRCVRATLLAAYARAGRDLEAIETVEEALRAHPEAKGLYGELRRLRRRGEAAAAVPGAAPDASSAPVRAAASRPRRPKRTREAEQLELGALPRGATPTRAAPAAPKGPRGR
jgi:tetratricopeptide (TPR) repeat protein